jgi:hypothetical protein
LDQFHTFKLPHDRISELTDHSDLDFSGGTLQFAHFWTKKKSKGNHYNWSEWHDLHNDFRLCPTHLQRMKVTLKDCLVNSLPPYEILKRESFILVTKQNDHHFVDEKGIVL